MNFEGTYVAMVTPFTDDGNIDEEGFRSNINYLIDKGVTGLLGAGTSGESATLTHEEHRKVVEILIDEVGGKRNIYNCFIGTLHRENAIST